MAYPAPESYSAIHSFEDGVDTSPSTTNCVTPTLPQELIDLILDNISSPQNLAEWRTVAACTVVCRAWLPRSSMLLFNRVRISSRRFLKFLAFAKTSPRLSFYLRGIDNLNTWNIGTEPVQWLQELFDVFPHLTFIGLRYGWAVPTDKAPALPLRRYRVETLQLDTMIDRQLPWVLAHFEHVRTFELIQCVCHMPYKSLHHPSCVQIESLKFKRSLAGNLRMLAPLVDPNALRSVQIDGRLDGYAEMAEALDDFLRIAGSKIEYLSVLMGWSGGRPSATSLSSLSTCTELRCLKLWLAEAWQFDFLCHNILPFITSSIRKISICFWLDWFEQFFASGPAWRNLERGLDRCLPTLDELVFDEICEAELVDRWHNQISAELSPQFRRLIRVIPQHS